jgi:hypothetical protein
MAPSPSPASPIRQATLGELDSASGCLLGLLGERFESQQDLLESGLGAKQHAERFAFGLDANLPDVAAEVAGEAEAFPGDLFHRRHHFSGFGCS